VGGPGALKAGNVSRGLMHGVVRLAAMIRQPHPTAAAVLGHNAENAEIPMFLYFVLNHARHWGSRWVVRSPIHSVFLHAGSTHAGSTLVNITVRIMDPLAIVSLIGTCTSIATRVLATMRDLDELITKIKNIDKAASQLAAQLKLFSGAVTQLQQWIGRATAISNTVRDTLRSALSACDEIVAEIEDHVKRMMPREGSRIGFLETFRALWNERTVQDHIRMLTTQFQTFSLFIQLLGL
jgi:hypothetical protein